MYDVNLHSTHAENMTNPFEMKIGTKQTCELSPNGFSLSVNLLSQRTAEYKRRIEWKVIHLEDLYYVFVFIHA